MSIRALRTDRYQDRSVTEVEVVDEDGAVEVSWEFCCDTCDEFLVGLSDTDAHQEMGTHQCVPIDDCSCGEPHGRSEAVSA